MSDNVIEDSRKPEGSPYTPTEQALVNELVHSAAVAVEIYGEDELERFAEEQRRQANG